jgi:hypothetical protein
MRLRPAALYEVVTLTSRYIVDTTDMVAVREARTPPDERAARDRVVHKNLFVDHGLLQLAALPDVSIGEPMRLSIWVEDNFLTPAERGQPTTMVTTAVTDVTLLG